MNKIQNAHPDLQHCRQGDGQPYTEQGRSFLPVHKVGHRDVDTEGSHDSLDHDKRGAAASVKVPDKAEEEGHQQRVNGVCSPDS